ncbi:CPSF A subunit region-domain-containing protein [Choanephora cucurbitarum]|nr:CPSF A subunit region-domain-containing protein [Choanephora cucurbitarum]
MKKHHVVTTINPATAVTSAVKGRFIHASAENLLVSKGSTVEVYTILADGIKLSTEFSVYGVIDKLEICQIPDRDTCSVFILTDQKYFTIISYSARTETMITEGHGLLDEPRAKISDQATAVVTETKNNTLLVSAYTSYLFSIPLNRPDASNPNSLKGKAKSSRFSASSIRTNEFDFLDMVALKGIQQSCIAALLGEINELKTIKIFRCDPQKSELVENEKLTVKVEATTHMLIPVPNPIGGLLAVGEYILSYHDLSTNSREPKELSIDPVTITSYVFLEGSCDSCLLGDSEGYLYFLRLETINMKVNNIHSTMIGQIPVATCLVDLGNQLFFAGSTKADSCVFRLNRAPNGRSTIEILNYFYNLAPIVDFCLFDYDQQGKQTMICCSGVDRDGSLRIVENGVGFTEQYNLDIPLIKDIWTLTSSEQQSQDALLISTFDQSIFLKQKSPTEYTEYNIYASIDTKEITLASTVTHSGQLCQVTPSFVRLMEHAEYGILLDEWRPPNGQQIALARTDATHCIVCYGEGTLAYFEFEPKRLQPKSTRQLQDVVCMQLSLSVENGLGRDCVLIGSLQERKIYLVELPNLDATLLELNVHQDLAPTDMIMAQFGTASYLMVLFGDGQLSSYVIEKKGHAFHMGQERQTMIGTYCTGMTLYQQNREYKVFIAGSRPTVVSHQHGALSFSAVNLKDVYRFNALPHDQAILMTQHGLLFGKIDNSQQLHHTKIKTHPNDMPTRIRYMPQLKLLAVGAIVISKNVNNNIMHQQGKLSILDAQTLQTLDSFSFEGNEVVESMTISQFSGYRQEFLFVGTAIPDAEDGESSRGRILVFQVNEARQLELIESVDMPGVVYDLKPCQKSIVACVNGSVFCLSIFRPDLPAGTRIKFDLNVHRNVLALCMDVRDDQVLIGDLMRSVSVLSATQHDPLKLELQAMDSKPTWMTAVKFIDEHVYMGADDKSNLFTLTWDKHGVKNAHGISKLEVLGGFHLGSLVNCFREGTLMDTKNQMKKHSMIKLIDPSFTFVTVHGSIGVVKTITTEAFELFQQLQEGILKESHNVGKLDYAAWRSYKPKISHLSDQQASCYLDGDVLKKFADMSKHDKQKILTRSSLLQSFDVKQIEDLVYDLVSN